MLSVLLMLLCLLHCCLYLAERKYSETKKKKLIIHLFLLFEKCSCKTIAKAFDAIIHKVIENITQVYHNKNEESYLKVINSFSFSLETY